MDSQIFMTDLDGGNIHRLTHSGSMEVEAKVNPKTGTELVFVSGRGGTPQIYRMSIDGTDVSRLTTGEGDAVNPSWNPDGQHIAFAWTRGFEPGNYNIFIMDVASRDVVQLTHGAGRNENPSMGARRRALGFLIYSRRPNADLHYAGGRHRSPAADNTRQQREACLDQGTAIDMGAHSAGRARPVEENNRGPLRCARCLRERTARGALGQLRKTIAARCVVRDV